MELASLHPTKASLPASPCPAPSTYPQVWKVNANQNLLGSLASKMCWTCSRKLRTESQNGPTFLTGGCLALAFF